MCTNVSILPCNHGFSALPPGPYTIQASLPGFREAQRADVRLPIASQVDVPFVLEVGGVQETVTVTDVAPLVFIDAPSRDGG